MLQNVIHLPDDDAPRVPDPWDDLTSPQARRAMTLLLEEPQHERHGYRPSMPVVIHRHE